jgi:hypothetical protein
MNKLIDADLIQAMYDRTDGEIVKAIERGEMQRLSFLYGKKQAYDYVLAQVKDYPETVTQFLGGKP